ncbi:AAA family ATPase [Halococcoides cellulosivorans]|uniref:ATPase n=1 Tax=Halococcoides cellulosivorans TaxID=1679096 RepID=A0A2R4X2V8_9EURY|nr:MoxR family ATPase [Halococcoides cellulosivorans]AWB28136.1 ATPase [Halococcoides cellulosivorans]
MDSPESITAASETTRRVRDRIASAVVIDDDTLATMVTALLARGHVLLEDVPGTGKTVTARVLAEALGLEFNRVQFTPDLLPSDVTGSTVYDETAGTFEFSEGPIFANVVLADEINRAPPKTQAALLEAMEDRQVSVDGTTHPLPDPFLVIATQNPIEQEGTFRLPEAQRDRFAVKTALGYADAEGEMELLDRRASRHTLSPSVEAVTDAATVRTLQEICEGVQVTDRVRRYIVDLARTTRADDRVDVGVSPRGIQRIFEVARARAVLQDRDYVTPEDVQAIAQPTMAHRVVRTTEATVEGVEQSAIVADAIDRVAVPAVAPSDAAADTGDKSEVSEEGDPIGASDDGDTSDPSGAERSPDTPGSDASTPDATDGADPDDDLWVDANDLDDAGSPDGDAEERDTDHSDGRP